MSDFDYETKAKNLLGKSGKLPVPPVNPHSAVAAANQSAHALERSLAAFKKGTGDLEKQLLEAQKNYGALRNTLKQYRSLVDGSDFGLDDNKPEEKKKLDEVKKIMKTGLDSNIAKVDSTIKVFENVDEVLTHLQRLDTAKVCST